METGIITISHMNESLTRIFRLITYYAIVHFTQPVTRKSYSLARKKILQHTLNVKHCSLNVLHKSHQPLLKNAVF